MQCIGDDFREGGGDLFWIHRYSRYIPNIHANRPIDRIGSRLSLVDGLLYKIGDIAIDDRGLCGAGKVH